MQTTVAAQKTWHRWTDKPVNLRSSGLFREGGREKYPESKSTFESKQELPHLFTSLAVATSIAIAGPVFPRIPAEGNEQTMDPPVKIKDLAAGPQALQREVPRFTCILFLHSNKVSRKAGVGNRGSKCPLPGERLWLPPPAPAARHC